MLSMPNCYGNILKLQSLRCLCTIVDEGFNISRAARILHTSQPGISKQIRVLEQELAVEILLRRGGRIAGLTAPGNAVLGIARQMVRDAENLRRISEDFANQASGRLILATTHLHARYVLLHVVEDFRRRYPAVQLVLRQGTPSEIFRLLASGDADIGISNEIAAGSPALLELACGKMPRCVVVPKGHPLTRLRRLTLKQISGYPLITLARLSPGGLAVARAFALAGLEPRIVMEAIDTDVAKAYVEMGLGIAIMPVVAVDSKRDNTLTAIDATSLFGAGTMSIALDPRCYLRAYMYDFIAMLSPAWTRERVNAALRVPAVRQSMI